MAQLPLTVLNSMYQTAALGCEIAARGARGRGVVATRGHARGAVVLPASEPLASSGRAAYAFAPENAAGRKDYEASYAKARAALAGDRRYPLLAASVACRVKHEPDPNASAFVIAVAALVQAKIDAAALAADAAAVREAVGADFVTDAWYAGVVGRLHLNAMRVGDDSLLLGLASFLNHNRAPSLELATDASFVAARDVAAGEELTIDYAHEKSGDEKRIFLLDTYGFDDG